MPTLNAVKPLRASWWIILAMFVAGRLQGPGLPCRVPFAVSRRRRITGFLGIAELLVRLLRRGGVVREYPTMLESRLLGVSKMKTLRTIRGHLGLLWQVVRGRVK